METEEIHRIENKAIAIVKYGFHLEYLIVDSQYQGQGYGKQLLATICNRSTVTLDCEPSLIKYYEKQGFRCTNRQLYYRRHFLRLMVHGVKLTTRQLNRLVQLLTEDLSISCIFIVIIGEHGRFFARSKPP